MTKIRNPSAFPVLKQDLTGDLYCADPGMTLRDWFAGQALPTVLKQVTEYPDEHWRVGVAMDAYMMADAMLAVRSGHKPIDIEYMLAVCVPGGSSCDPQAVADRIRDYWRANGGAA